MPILDEDFVSQVSDEERDAANNDMRPDDEDPNLMIEVKWCVAIGNCGLVCLWLCVSRVVACFVVFTYNIVKKSVRRKHLLFWWHNLLYQCAIGVWT